MNYWENGVKLIYKMMPSPAANRYHGLLNQGATDYLNSVLQVLFMTEDFIEAVERHTCENPGTECIDPHLTSLFNDLKERTAYTYTITQKMGINNVYEQRDAAEYYEKILGLTSPDASKVKKTLSISKGLGLLKKIGYQSVYFCLCFQIFHGLLTHKTICSACHTETDTDGAFWHLSLALVDYSEHYSVVNGIEEYFRATDFSGENQMYCDKCDAKSNATIKCVIKHHPEVLMLLLKRFEFDYRYMTYVKINRTVDVPHTLQIPENQAYELYAVVQHFGDLRSEHYAATIKSQEDDRWYNFSDATVTLMDYQPFQLDGFEKSSSAYLLFYRKKKVHPADTCSQDIREVPTPGGFLPSTCDIYDHGQDAAEREEYEKAAEAGNNTAVAVSIDINEETGNKDLVSVPERSRELGVSSDLYIEDQDFNARPSIPYNHQECNEERNDLSYRPQGAHAERPRDEEKTVMDDEDLRGNAEAKDQAVKRETQLEESVAHQENDSGRLDDVRHKKPHACLEGDDIPNTSGNHQKYQQEVSSMHERREYPHQVCVDMQRDEERMVMDVNRDRDGKMERWKVNSQKGEK
ncbi:ubiquitin carboxyl-terminal hydrolase 12-like isoform X2 [Perca flavescens]|uniref:ubiquitin carboxyl-terminal hydrolase 12-like isoform X2 n=1 Tax=Perca flavescens TaxID=8167 RepID=UPI00106DF090|nr:ubiquitin carboxyl-terminal hydrolase 12-like isoform X2 [Perca flavescens]